MEIKQIFKEKQLFDGIKGTVKIKIMDENDNIISTKIVDANFYAYEQGYKVIYKESIQCKINEILIIENFIPKK